MDSKAIRQAAGVTGAVGVAIGALGAHALQATLTSRGTLASFHTGVHYQLFHAVALLALSSSSKGTENSLPAKLWLGGVTLFSGSIYALSLGVGPRAILGPVTPVGGNRLVQSTSKALYGISASRGRAFSTLSQHRTLHNNTTRLLLSNNSRRWQQNHVMLTGRPLGRFFCAKGTRESLIRNIGVIAHVDAGKTTTTERMLFYSKKIRAMGDVDTGDTTMDFLPQEQARGITIQAACTTFQWGDYRMNLIDTPGHVDFTLEVERSMRVLDGAVTVLDAVKGVEPQTLTVWKQANKYKVPRILFVNKMDRDGASLDFAIKSCQERLVTGSTAEGISTELVLLPVQVPYGNSGIVDLVEGCVWEWDFKSDPTGGTFIKTPFSKFSETEDWYVSAMEAKTVLMEKLSDVNDTFAEEYLASLEDPSSPITTKQLRKAIRASTIACRAVPVLCGSSLKNKGVQPLLDAVGYYLPAPIDKPLTQAISLADGGVLERQPSPKDPLCALAFKITHDSQRGALVYVRVFSGTIRERDTLVNTSTLEIGSGAVVSKRKAVDASKLRKERVSKVLEVHADDSTEVSMVEAGDIACLVGLRTVKTGDTLISSRDVPVKVAGITIPNPVFFCSIEAQNLTEQTKLEEALQVVIRDDPSLQVSLDQDTGQTLLKGMGELHLDVVRETLVSEFGLKVEFGKMNVAYQETIQDLIEKTHDYQSTVSGKEISAQVTLRLEPNPGCGVAFESELPEESQVTLVEYIQQGVTDALCSGPLMGYPMSDVKVVVVSVDAPDEGANLAAFQTCASLCVSLALREAREQMVLLEPVMLASVTTPNSHVGDVVTDLVNRRRGSIRQLLPQPQQETVVEVEVPLSEMVGYSTALRSRTAGAGSFAMEYLAHRTLPPAEQSKLIL